MSRVQALSGRHFIHQASTGKIQTSPYRAHSPSPNSSSQPPRIPHPRPPFVRVHPAPAGNEGAMPATSQGTRPPECHAPPPNNPMTERTRPTASRIEIRAPRSSQPRRLPVPSLITIRWGPRLQLGGCIRTTPRSTACQCGPHSTGVLSSQAAQACARCASRARLLAFHRFLNYLQARRLFVFSSRLRTIMIYLRHNSQRSVAIMDVTDTVPQIRSSQACACSTNLGPPIDVSANDGYARYAAGDRQSSLNRTAGTHPRTHASRGCRSIMRSIRECVHATRQARRYLDSEQQQ